MLFEDLWKSKTDIADMSLHNRL